MNKKAFSLIELSIVVLIIGIIVAGVTQSSRLIGAFKLNTARNVTQSSPVHSIKDLALWLEPVMENSITSATNANAPENSDRISSWNDFNTQSAQKINLTQGTNGSRPYYVLSGINNLPTLQFSGAQYMDSSIVPIPSAYKEYTIFLVWKQTSSTGTQVMVHQRGAISCTGGDRAGIYTYTGSVYSWGCGGGDQAVVSYSVNTNYLSVYRVDNSQANNVTNFLNGTKYGPLASSLNNIGASAFAVGFGNDSGGSYYYTGYISEVIVFARALKDSEITDIRSYISKKYGFSA